MYIVYALLSQIRPIIYVGFTTDLETRLRRHNAGTSRWSKKYRPWKLMYQEQVQDRVTARQREKQLKHGSGKEFLKRFAGIV